MKTIKYYSYLLFMLVLAFGMAACEGPAGPLGEQGLQGEQGPPGENGQDGEDGNANVMYSDWIDIVWDDDGSDPTANSMRIPEPRINEAFIDSGYVAMYLKQETPDGSTIAVVSIPFMLDENELVYFVMGITSGPVDFQGIILYQMTLDNAAISNDLTISQVRYVLIPGTVAINQETSARSLPVDLNNYKEVAKYFGIPD